MNSKDCLEKECCTLGHLVNGIWETSSTKEIKTDGQFVRKASAFRNWVTEDGAPGPTGEGGFAAEAGRYHLYVSYACPWAHRALIYRSILGLEDAIDISVVHPVNMENGWDFEAYPGATPDKIGNARYMHEVYTRAAPDYSGKVTVPVLWDRKTGSIVNNESADLIRMIGKAFRPFAKSWQEFLPDDLLGEIDEINDLVYRAINNGVYRTGFAETQEAYEAGIDAMFGAFETLDERLAKTRFLHGDRIVNPTCGFSRQ